MSPTERMKVGCLCHFSHPQDELPENPSDNPARSITSFMAPSVQCLGSEALDPWPSVYTNCVDYGRFRSYTPPGRSRPRSQAVSQNYVQITHRATYPKLITSGNVFPFSIAVGYISLMGSSFGPYHQVSRGNNSLCFKEVII